MIDLNTCKPGDVLVTKNGARLKYLANKTTLTGNTSYPHQAECIIEASTDNTFALGSNHYTFTDRGIFRLDNEFPQMNVVSIERNNDKKENIMVNLNDCKPGDILITNDGAKLEYINSDPQSTYPHRAKCISSGNGVEPMLPGKHYTFTDIGVYHITISNTGRNICMVERKTSALSKSHYFEASAMCSNPEFYVHAMAENNQAVMRIADGYNTIQFTFSPQQLRILSKIINNTLEKLEPPQEKP